MTESCLLGDKAASGSSRRYSPSPPNRFTIKAKNASPGDCSCKGRSPYEGAIGGPGPPSASSFSISVATLKKLSARRKKPSRGRATPRATRRNRCSSECDSRVPNLKFFEPPSALKPQATAMASSSVDLPEPFSPTKNVTAGCSSRVSNGRTAANEKG